MGVRKIENRKICKMSTNRWLLIVAEVLFCCLLWCSLSFLILACVWPFVVYFLCKLLEQLIYKVRYNAIASTYIDALWLRETHLNRMIISALLVTEGDVDIARFREKLTKKLEINDNSNASPYFKSKKRILHGYLHYYWVDEENFNIANHVKLWPKVIYSKLALRHLLSDLCAKEFDANFSPWEFILISFLDDDKIMKTAIFVRVHHCIADGITLTRFLVHELADETVVTVPLRKFSEISRCLMMLKGLFWGPYFMLNILKLPADQSIIHGRHLIGSKSVTWTEAIDFSIVKDIQNKTCSTVNEVIITTMSGAINCFLRKKAVTYVDDIKIALPIDLKPNMDAAAIKFENDITVLPFQLPTSTVDPLNQLKEVKLRSNKLKKSGEPFTVGIALKMCTRIVPWFMLDMLNKNISQKTTAVFSNMPGPQNTIKISGREMKTLIFWAPQRENVGLSFSFATYGNKLFVGVQSDTALLVEPDEICQEFLGKLLELQRAVDNMIKMRDNMTAGQC